MQNSGLKANTRQIGTTHLSYTFDGVNRPALISDIVLDCLKDCPTIKTSKKIDYYNVPIAFDIETSSFYENGEKRAIMWGWTLGINGVVVLGRTWKEFTDTMETISSLCKLNKNKRIVCYVHNLGYDFQFFRHWLEWVDVFAVDDRKPVYAISTLGIEFRCSYILSGESLENVGKELKKYPVHKMVGDLDYNLLRNSNTPITKKEIRYMENDVRVIMSFIQETIEHDGDISKIPLTKTGYARKYCRNMCLYDGSHRHNVGKYLKYHELMLTMQLDVETYYQMRRAFQGGFTHGNPWHSMEINYNVGSFDFTSSYPAVLLCEEYPCDSGKLIQLKSKEHFYKCLKTYCCLFDAEFIGLESAVSFEHPISKSHCWDLTGATEDNGRIVEAETLKTTITEQDFFVYEKFYKWKKLNIANFRIFHKSYLPTDLVKSILKLYQDKTQLKGVKSTPEHDYESMYMVAKGLLNSVYGMCVTDIIRDTHTLQDGEWSTIPTDIEKALEKENKSKRRFLFYGYGVWCTAYARRNLFTGIYEFGNATHPEYNMSDYIYSDTDSIKALHCERHQAYINAYNDNIRYKMDKAMDYHGLPRESTRPKTTKGVEKQIGVWDYEGEYKVFKSLGAKRYAVLDENYNLSITISGVNKKVAVPYLIKKYGKYKFFEVFNDDLVFPVEATGKQTHTYVDDEIQGECVDYLGNKALYNERSFIHMEGCEYKLSLSNIYLDYLMGLKEISYE